MTIENQMAFWVTLSALINTVVVLKPVHKMWKVSRFIVTWWKFTVPAYWVTRKCCHPMTELEARSFSMFKSFFTISTNNSSFQEKEPTFIMPQVCFVPPLLSRVAFSINENRTHPYLHPTALVFEQHCASFLVNFSNTWTLLICLK